MTTFAFAVVLVLGITTTVQGAGICGGIFCKSDGDCPIGQGCEPSECGGFLCTPAPVLTNATVSRDPCRNFLCANGGSCTAPADAPYCLCPEGFTGTRCETRIGHAGSCPSNEPGTGGVCGGPSDLWCSSDDECGTGQKCCHNPCGTPACTNVELSSGEKPGKCPEDLISLCFNFCEEDYSCPGVQKCCWGCGTLCVDPVL